MWRNGNIQSYLSHLSLLSDLSLFSPVLSCFRLSCQLNLLLSDLPNSPTLIPDCPSTFGACCFLVFASLKTGRALTKNLHTFSLFLFKKTEQSNRNKENLFIKIPQMGNIILGPFEETTLCYDKAWMMKFSTHALSPGTSPVFLPSYNLLPRERSPLKNPFSPSDGLDSSQAIGGVVEGKVWKEGFNHLLWETNHRNTQVQNGNWWLAPIFHLFFRNRGKYCALQVQQRKLLFL